MNWDWPIIVEAAGVFITLVGFIIRNMVANSKTNDIAVEANKKADSVSRKADTEKDERQRLALSFSEFKAEVAREYTSKGTSQQMESRLMAAIQALGQQFERFADRLADRFDALSPDHHGNHTRKD